MHSYFFVPVVTIGLCFDNIPHALVDFFYQDSDFVGAIDVETIDLLWREKPHELFALLKNFVRERYNLDFRTIMDKGHPLYAKFPLNWCYRAVHLGEIYEKMPETENMNRKQEEITGILGRPTGIHLGVDMPDMPQILED